MAGDDVDVPGASWNSRATVGEALGQKEVVGVQESKNLTRRQPDPLFNAFAGPESLSQIACAIQRAYFEMVSTLPSVDPAVDDDELDVRVALQEDRANRGLDECSLVERRRDDADAWPGPGHPGGVWGGG